MARVIYVNGQYQPYAQGLVHAEDRGFQFADAIYEVCEVRDGALIDETRHLDRLDRSLDALMMPAPMSRAALSHVLHETVRRNRVHDGLVYLQVSRGAGPRNFLFPPAGTPATVVCIARPVALGTVEARARHGIAVITLPDTRWARCDIKTVMLLPASLAKQEAFEAGSQEAWFYDETDSITEGASSNAWIVDQHGILRTRACDAEILRGVTRTTLIDAIRSAGLEFVEQPFTRQDIRSATEAFITSATTIVMPVIRVDGTSVGNGVPGPVAKRLRALFHGSAERVTV
jgi:D-alanine transaminase